jgi:hypothetical protein
MADIYIAAFSMVNYPVTLFISLIVDMNWTNTVFIDIHNYFDLKSPSLFIVSSMKSEAYRHHISESWFRFQSSPYGIHGGKSDTERVFSPSTYFGSPCQYYHSIHATYPLFHLSRTLYNLSMTVSLNYTLKNYKEKKKEERAFCCPCLCPTLVFLAVYETINSFAFTN